MRYLFFNSLYKKIYTDENLNEAWRKVRNNGDSPGVDGITLTHFGGSIFLNLKKLQKDLKKGVYKPQPIKRFYVIKEDGRKRPLSILTVRDRIVQRAVLQVIEPLFEPHFLDCSYAFRKGRSPQMAIEEAKGFICKGHSWVVDIDIQSFFENIDRDRLYSLIKKKVKDKRLRSMIRSWIFHEAEGTRAVNGRGIVQGSPLSPLFANIYLHQFDRMAAIKGLKIIRYSDDILAFCKSLKEAQKTLKIIKRLLRKLNLMVNERKTRILQVNKGLKFLGEEITSGL